MNWCIASVRDFTEEDLAAAYKGLSPSRKAHIDRFRHDGARRQSLAGELLLRRLLAQLGIHAPIERLASGQPVLADRSACISISHCGDYVVCAVSEKPVGIDIEKVRPVKPGMAERICTAEELQYVGCDESRFFEVWTAKEAYFKMQGTGITDFRSVNTLALPRKVVRQGDYCIQIVYEE